MSERISTTPIVLVVDDDPHMLSVISKALQIVGHFEVETAEDGVIGLERFFEIHPQCVVIDVKMPHMDGYQLIRALRGDPESAATPLVILTAMAQDKDKFRGMASGADRYLLKPVRPDVLVQNVREAIRISQLERQQRLREMAGDDPFPSTEG
jgi:DNA-binding response OmpR family regulator